MELAQLQRLSSVARTVFRRALLLLIIASPAAANVKSYLPDFYAEPGLNPFRMSVQDQPDEVVDTFSGALRLVHTDLVVPGNGGFDFRVRRIYNSTNVYTSRKTPVNLAPNLTELLPRTPTGLGWTLHFGRVVKAGPTIGESGVCGTLTDPEQDSLNNAVLETPDGSQQIFFINATSFSPGTEKLITRDQWVGECLTGGGVLAISPEGVKYTMNYLRAGVALYDATQSNYAWYATRIEDRNGNWMNIEYDTDASPPGMEAALSRVTTSDGRTITFTYTDRTDYTKIRLTRISANGQSWDYNYTTITGISGGYYYLSGVTRPDGTDWDYTYHSKTAGQPGNRILQRVTHPYGGTITYNYDYKCFMAPSVGCSSAYNTFNSLVVSSKSVGGRDVSGGTWTYSYSPGSSVDTTTVNFPGGKHVYQHYGAHSVYGSATLNGKRLWKVGLLTKHETYNGSSLVHREVYTWDAPYKISNEKYVRPPYDGSDSAHGYYYDDYTWAPVLLRTDITRDGATYTTTHSNFDASYNPQTVTESGQDNRTTSLTYFPRSAGQNIVRLVKDEAVSGATYASTSRIFDSKGNPTRITRHGIQDNFSYYSAGDVSSRTNARSQNWTYTGYYRGIPQSENWPAGVSISRNVSGDGTISSERDGRGNTTTYTYDGLNRVTGIDPPRGSSTSVNWSSTGRTVTRGGYSQSMTFDGFGRPSLITTEGITQNINYNALGQKTFESYPGSSSGTSYSVDVLGRVTGMSHPDGSGKSIGYGANTVSVSNERGYTAVYTYRSFGNPDRVEDRALTNITAPESGSVSISINKVGNPTSMSQGGVIRSYGYDGSNCLTSETNPETGTTAYGRDAVCNMTSRRVGSSGTTTFGYDGLSRRTSINYPGSPDVTLDYDGNSNLTLLDNGVARRTYGYDANNNLDNETLTIDGRSFTANYSYDSLDFLSSLTYPSGRVVTFAPSDLGRPTQVSPFVTSVTHHDNGVPASIRYANGVTTTISLDSRQWINRMDGTASTLSLGYSYDGAGNVTGITNGLDSADSKSLTYDGLDRLTRAGTATMSYDAAGNLQNLNTALGNLSLSYSSNRLSSVSGWRNGAFSYDSYGNVTNDGRFGYTFDDASSLRSMAGAAAAGFDYDGANRRVREVRGGVTSLYFYSRDGNLLGEYTAAGAWRKEYAYLKGKLVAQIEQPPSPSLPPALAATTVPAKRGQPLNFSWNRIGTPATYDWVGVYTPGSSDFNYLDWTYTNGGASGTGSLTLSHPGLIAGGTYELRFYANDGFSLVAKSAPFVLDPTGPVVAVTTAPAILGQPVIVKWSGIAAPTPTDWVGIYRPNTSVFSYLDYVYTDGQAQGSLSFSLTSGSLSAGGSYEMQIYTNDSYTMLAKSPAFTAYAGTPPPVVSYLHFDAIGSPVSATNSTGTVLYRERYAPYGARERQEAAGSANTRWYTGHSQDKATGLIYTGARWYDPQIGRFLSTDPQGFSHTNLQSFNRYAYANNNPYRYVDPDGNVAETVADVISLGLSINSFLQEPSLFNALGVAVDAVGTAVPFLPAGLGTIRAIGQGADDVLKGVARAGASEGQRGTAVLGHFPEYLQKADQLGARRFNIPADVYAKMSPSERWAANQRFLDRLTSRGDEVVLTTPVGRVTPGSTLEREVQYLLGRGYRAVEGGTRLVPGP